MKKSTIIVLLSIALAVSLWNNVTKGMARSQAFDTVKQYGELHFVEDAVYFYPFAPEGYWAPSIDCMTALSIIGEYKEGFYISQ